MSDDHLAGNMHAQASWIGCYTGCLNLEVEDEVMLLRDFMLCPQRYEDHMDMWMPCNMHCKAAG